MKQLFNALKSNIQSAQAQSRTSNYKRQLLASPIPLVLVSKAMKCTFLSFGVPTKSGIAKDLIEADDIGRKAVLDFIDSVLVENLSLTTPKMQQANKVLRLARSRRNCPIYKT